MTRVAEGWAVKHILDIATLWAVGARPSPGLTNTLGVTGGSAPTPRDPVFSLPARTVNAMCALDCTLHMQSGVRSSTHVWERTGAGLPTRKERLCGTDVTHLILGLRGCRSAPPPLGLKTGAAPSGDSPTRPTSTPKMHLKRWEPLKRQANFACAYPYACAHILLMSNSSLIKHVAVHRRCLGRERRVSYH